MQTVAVSSLLLTSLAVGAPTQATSAGLVVPGKVAQALQFDGAHYVRPPELGMFDKLTIALWIRPEKNPERIVTLLNTDHWQENAAHFQLYDGAVQYSVLGAGEVMSENRPGLKFGEWEHIVVTYDAAAKTSAVYINGTLDRRATLERSIPADYRAFSIGAWNSGEREYIGLMDDLRIYNCALDDAGIAALAHGRDTTVKPVARWTFDGMRGRKIADGSGNGHDAVLIGVSPYRGADVGKVAAAMGIPLLRRGFVSGKPSEDWTKALISGNGVMGALVMGEPEADTIILSHAGLYLPLWKPLPPVDTASHLKEIRQMMADGQYQRAADYVVELSHKEGWGGKRWTDPFVPACDVLVNMVPRGDVGGYLRGVDFPTGVAAVRWQDDRGVFVRRVFVSRPDNVVVLAITGPGKVTVDCALQLAQRPHAWGVKDVIVGADANWLTYRGSFENQWPGSLQGCEVVARVVATHGTTTNEGNKIVVKGADEVLVLMRVNPTKDFATSGIDELKKELTAMPTAYDVLLQRHAKEHGAIFNRMRLDLGGGAADHALTSEKLLEKSKVGDLSKALLEKEFDASRYAILSSSGDQFPNLQGIWTGTWSPPWSGDYTMNGNVQSAIASDLSANMAECLLPHFRYLESQMHEYRENAKRLYGCRGIHVPSRTSSHGLNNHFDEGWPMTFWTAGAGWAAHFYYDYWLYTGDREFLLKRAVPFMKEAAAFYEDFLVEGPDGNYLFSPSYSPENNPRNNQSQACINATMDIAVAKELLANLVTVCSQQKIEAEKVNQWKAMLAKMPAYMTNQDGAVKEWTTPLLEDNYEHRHCSHLYALFDGMPDEIATNPALRKAFMSAAEKRMDVRKREHGGVMAFGLVQLGQCVSSLHDAAMSYEVVDWLANNYRLRNMMTTHDPGGIFNTDASGGLPHIIVKMLVDAQPGRIEVLPALPAEWPSGTIEGVRCRGQIEMRRLTWDAAKIVVTLRSDAKQDVTLKAPGGYSRVVSLPPDRDITVEIARTPK